MSYEIPGPITFPWDPDDPEPLIPHGPWIVEITWGIVDGRLECTGLSVQHRTGSEPVTSTLLRRFNVGRQLKRWREQMIRDAEMVLDPEAEDLFSPRLRSQMQQRKDLASGQATRYDIDHYRQVAAIYNIAYQNGAPPTKAVAEHFETVYGKAVHRSSAAKWVMKCRDLGLLPPTQPRTPAGDPLKGDESE